MLTVLPHGTFTVNRFGPTTTTASGVTPGTQTSLTTTGSKCPASPYDIARLEEGKRTRQSYKYITDDVLLVAGQSGQLPDWIQADGYFFEVTMLLPFRNGVMSHYEYLITKIENPGDYGTL